MHLNDKQRARWLSDIISELQRYISKNQDCPEIALAQQAASRLQDTRQQIRESAAKQGDRPCP